jgi:ferric-dicitrate binding protein FerR (iron transport regulator)
MDKFRLRQLVDQYLTGSASNDQQSALLEELLSAGNRENLEALMHDQYATGTFTGEEDALQREKLFERIQAAKQSNAEPAGGTVRHMPFLRRWSWAAAVILVCAGAYFYRVSTTKVVEVAKIPTAKKNQPIDLPPGKDGAVLTLADGTQVALDSLGNGHVATQNGMNVQLTNGRLAYNSPSSFANNDEVIYNTLVTPKGRQFQLVLPDGSRVWLNAASSIKYPVTFGRKSREVEVTGEAYFEVAQDNSKSFKVLVHSLSGNSEVDVLGTHFNINAYDDEAAVKTTLLEGAVRVNKGIATSVLKPGQQSSVGSNGPVVVKDEVDIDEVVAWKNGSFVFNRQDIKSIMRQIARWYDVNVVYEDQPSDETFSGIVSRKSDLSQVLKIMEKNGVKFTIEEHKIIVKQ